MNEAERCDRISLMHAGKVLAADTPKGAEWRAAAAKTLEEAFIGYLEDAARAADQSQESARCRRAGIAPVKEYAAAGTKTEKFSIPRIVGLSPGAKPWRSYAIRYGSHLPCFGPILLMFAFGYGISFDIENLRFAVFDQSRSLESREFLESFEGSRFFERQPRIAAPEQIQTRLRSGELKFAIEIPPLFGSDLLRERRPEIGVWINGDMPFRAETTTHLSGRADAEIFATNRSRARHAGKAESALPSQYRDALSLQPGRSKASTAMVPSVIMLMLILIPAIMTALGVVREKETGSIANFRSTPMTGLEFLLGKQMPYVADRLRQLR